MTEIKKRTRVIAAKLLDDMCANMGLVKSFDEGQINEVAISLQLLLDDENFLSEEFMLPAEPPVELRWLATQFVKENTLISSFFSRGDFVEKLIPVLLQARYSKRTCVPEEEQLAHDAWQLVKATEAADKQRGSHDEGVACALSSLVDTLEHRKNECFACNDLEGNGPHTCEKRSCTCAEIMEKDQTRHFRGCPLRERYQTHEAELERTDDGRINNCALANGDIESNCQMCKGKCPDRK